jgi:hypothetical protein
MKMSDAAAAAIIISMVVIGSTAMTIIDRIYTDQTACEVRDD